MQTVRPMVRMVRWISNKRVQASDYPEAVEAGADSKNFLYCDSGVTMLCWLAFLQAGKRGCRTRKTFSNP
jgi:hypothetical protein